MPLDDLDFFLLDLVSDSPMSLHWLSLTDPEAALNRHIPPHTFEELTLALGELFARGDAVAYIRKRHSRRRSKPFVPTLDEIEAGLRGAFELGYELTPRGGQRWEKTVRPDWSLFLSSAQGQRLFWIEAGSRECLEYWIETERSQGRIGETVERKVLHPWRPVYWKELPSGYRVRCGCPRSNPAPLRTAGPFLYRNGAQDSRRNSIGGPRNLEARKERHALPGPAGEVPPVPRDEFLHRFWSVRGERKRFAFGCLYVRGAEARALLKLLPFRHGEVRFAVVRELVWRKEAAAVPMLIALVLRDQYLPALWALGEIADERALPVLAMLLEYGGACDFAADGGWHGTLARTLARVGDAALPLLEKGLTSKEYAVRSIAEAALALMRREDASQASLKRKHERAHQGAQHRLHQVVCVVGGKYDAPPADPVQAMVETLAHPDPARRRAAVDLLVEFGARDRLLEIGGLAKDPEWEVRASVAYAYRQLGGSRKVLSILARDKHPVVRWLARKDLIP